MHSSWAAEVGRQVSGFWEGGQAGGEGTSKWAPETKVWAHEEDQPGVDAFDWPWGGAPGKPLGFHGLPLVTKKSQPCRCALMMQKQANEQTVLPLAGPTSWATQGPALRRAPRSVKCSAVAILKFLIVLSLNVCFVSEVQQDKEHTWGQRRFLIRTRVLHHHSHTVEAMPLGHEVPGDPSRAGDLKQVQGERVLPGGCRQPREALLSVRTATCFECRKEGNDF